MEEPEYKPQYYYLDKIFLDEIVIDDTNKISIFGYLTDKITLKLVRWTFFSDFNQLTDILIAQGEKGNTVIMEVSKVLSDDYDIPTMIGVTESLNEYLLVDNFVFKTYVPLELNEFGDWVPTHENAVFIESITLKDDFIKESTKLVFISCIKNGKLMVDLLDDALNIDAAPIYAQQLKDYLDLLLSSFATYQGLIIKGFTDKKARKNAGLKNELLYRIAFANYKSLHT